MGEMDHEIDFGDVEIVKSPKTVQSVLDKRAMRDIWSAVRANDFDSVRRLLHAGNSVNETNSLGVTPLHICASMGHARIAKYLIRTTIVTTGKLPRLS